MPKEIVTSFRIDEELWRETKIHAVKNGITLKELLERLLREELKKTEK